MVTSRDRKAWTFPTHRLLLRFRAGHCQLNGTPRAFTGNGLNGKIQTRSVSRMNVKGFLLTVATTTRRRRSAHYWSGHHPDCSRRYPVTGNGKQIRAGIADGNTGRPPFTIGTTVGASVPFAAITCRKKTGCRILLPYYFFSSSVPRNYPARSPRFPASE